jgi:uncharacterized DUF497 family protein
MRFEWDEGKRWSNLRKHGIDFVEVEKVFEGETMTTLDERYLPEIRFLTLGLLKGFVVSIVHMETDESIRVISARKASKHEEKIYFQQIKN